MKDKLEQIFKDNHHGFGEYDKDAIIKELLNLFSVNYYGETLYNTDGVIPSKFEDEKPRIVTFKDHCS